MPAGDEAGGKLHCLHVALSTAVTGAAAAFLCRVRQRRQGRHRHVGRPGTSQHCKSDQILPETSPEVAEWPEHFGLNTFGTSHVSVMVCWPYTVVNPHGEDIFHPQAKGFGKNGSVCALSFGRVVPQFSIRTPSLRLSYMMSWGFDIVIHVADESLGVTCQQVPAEWGALPPWLALGPPAVNLPVSATAHEVCFCPPWIDSPAVNLPVSATANEEC